MGGDSGMGYATAEMLMREGVKVLVTKLPCAAAACSLSSSLRRCHRRLSSTASSRLSLRRCKRSALSFLGPDATPA